MPAESRTAALSRRREQLQQRCAIERSQVAQEAEVIETDLGRIDRGLKIARAVLTNPAVISVGVAAISMWGPGRALKLVARGLMLWSSVRRMGKF
ncbi:MAG TPA: YqjK family protein [Steroidobacteraceae bacterium]|jgi:hypothetical protein|nr:YqjK family protein [Steroidobacteraceae bacterium]